MPNEDTAEQQNSQNRDSIAWRRYEQARPRNAIDLPQKLLKRITGTFLFDDAVGAEIRLHDGQLFFTMIGQSAVELFAENETGFFFKAVPAQISVRAGQVPVEDLALHQHGLVLQGKRCTDEAFAAAQESFRARGLRKEKLGDGEAFLRSVLEALRHGTLTYDAMTPLLAALTEEQSPQARSALEQLGPLESLTFAGVRSDGFDIYTGIFVSGRMELGVSMNPSGLFDGFFLRAPRPHLR